MSSPLAPLFNVLSPSAPIFVHSDLFRVHELISSRASRREALSLHFRNLAPSSNNRTVAFPTFNYDFPATRTFDALQSPSQVGPLTEFVRRQVGCWRTQVPVFSACGTGQMPRLHLSEATLEPFGPRSIFSWLHENNGHLLYYGAAFGVTTFIHFAEQILGPPAYRYDKVFTGVVRDGEGERPIAVKFHVRPLGRALDYDWVRLAEDIDAHGLFVSGTGGRPAFVFAISVRALMEFWRTCLAADPLYFLDDETRTWCRPMLDRLGRRFEIRDFEGPESRLRI